MDTNKSIEVNEDDKRCAGGKWENQCDDWECLRGCRYENDHLTLSPEYCINTNAKVDEAFRIDVSDGRAVLPASTKDTFFEVLVVTSIAKTATECIFDGGEIGSTGRGKGTSRPKANRKCKRQQCISSGTSCLT